MEKIIISFIFLSYSYLDAMISARFETAYQCSEYLTKAEIDFEVVANKFNNPKELLDAILQSEKNELDAVLAYYKVWKEKPTNKPFMLILDKELNASYKQFCEAKTKLNNKNIAIKKKLI